MSRAIVAVALIAHLFVPLTSLCFLLTPLFVALTSLCFRITFHCPAIATVAALCRDFLKGKIPVHDVIHNGFD